MPRNRPVRAAALVLAVASPAFATSAPSSLPQVAWSQMGSVALGGAFSGLDWWSSSSSFSSSSGSQPFSTDGDTLFARDASGDVAVLGSTNSGGLVRALCYANSTSNGTLYIAGTFSSIGSTSAANIAAYSLDTATFSALGSGLLGPVNALFCDNANGEVWAGGEFNASTGSNVALWSSGSAAWQTVPFGGLNGVVDTIESGADGRSVIFGGAFTTTYLGSSSAILVNGTIGSGNVTSVSSASANTTTTGNSGYLTPFIYATGAGLTVTAGPSASDAQYSNPDVLLCPGAGTWMAADNQEAAIDITSTSLMFGTGVRVANGLVDGRATDTFCVTSEPDGTLLNMTYYNTTTKQNETCWYDCPLSYEVEAQDYIFTDGPRNMTSLHVVLHTWDGAGSALDWIQLLSEGAYVSAVAANNQGSCAANSSVGTTGSWTSERSGNQSYLSATASTSDANAADLTLTLYPHIASAANYDVYLVVPGCDAIGDCSGRTTVDVEVFPLQGGLRYTSTVSENVEFNTNILVYSGPVDASSAAFSPTVSVALPSSPAAVTGSTYEIVLEGVQFVFTGLGNATSSSSSSTNATTAANSTTAGNTTQVAYGVFEWNRANASVNAQTTLTNTTETALTQLGFALETAYRAAGASDWSVNAVASYNGVVYVGGDFAASGNYSNVVSSGGSSAALATEGLNGTVLAAAVVGKYIYFGGDFRATETSGTSLAHLARYDPTASAWAALAGGVDGAVTGLAVSGTDLVVVGNFSSVTSANGSTSATGGYAVYDTSVSDWAAPGVVYGNVSAAAISTSSSASTFLAGRVYGSASNAVDGVATLTDSNGQASISTLSGAIFGTTGSAPAMHRRAWARRAGDLLTRLNSVLDRSLMARAAAPALPALPAAVAPAVLAGAFYKNGSTAVTILGGNFTADSDAIEGVAFSENSALDGTAPVVTGVVRALDVVGNALYIGGSNISVDGVGSGLVVYDLATGSWATGIPSLGSNVTVNAVRARPDTNTVVAAGTFTNAGSLNCAAVCLWDSSSAQWSTPGSGISSGEVRAIGYAGSSYDSVVVAGSFVLSGSAAHVASYGFSNASWSALGTLPGPATALAVDNLNASNIFAAGVSTADASVYLSQWDGASWTAQNSTLAAGSVVTQLAFVPMESEHAARGAIESDRMLLVSGELYLSGVGNATAALFDGAEWYPYLVGTTSDGGLAASASLFWSDASFSFHVRHYLARGLVVLVAIAIATGLILLLVLLILLGTWLARRAERRRGPVALDEKDGAGSDGDVSSTHQHVLDNVQAALAQTLAVGAGAGAGAAAGGAGRRTSGESAYDDDDEGAAGLYAGTDDEGRETTMRYDFDGPELQPGEMSMRAGQRVVVLDDEQSDEWWYARDPATGREGVVPASYVW
ncbi:hypothetical protein Q5752_002454 [Cryptotrichosporon argae]